MRCTIFETPVHYPATESDNRGIDVETLKQMSLSEIVHEAWKVGNEIDLDGIGYGRIHWGNKKDVKTTPGPHYYLLAGLVRRFGFRRVCEIGTHCGGSAQAMRRGFVDDSRSLIVTVDITRESNRYLRGIDNIVKFVGDANRQKIVAKVFNELSGHPVDLLYIDADHKFFSAIMNYAVYSTVLRPKIVCLDDISLNDEMQEVWRTIQKTVPAEDLVNAVELIPEVRPGNPGFGCVVLRNHL
jgi:predicted O-methyltransferase YrrM